MCAKVVAVIVTYGNRFNLVKEVISAALEEGVDRIILVDNASVADSYNQIQLLALNVDSVTLIRMQENEGSAGGYYAGLHYVQENLQPDFVWMLDDDNVPQKDSLKNLLLARNLLISDEVNADVVLYSYRGDSRSDDKLAITNGLIKDYRPNNFSGLNFISSLKSVFLNKKENQQINYPVIKTNIGPYGGMFISVVALSKIGLPNKKLYLYADDHDFSLRLDKYDIKKYLVYYSKLKDIDFSFVDNDGILSNKIADLKVFYMIRNHTYLSKKFIKNRMFYELNKLAFVGLLFLNSIPIIIKDTQFIIKRMKIIMRAIYDGEKSRLGKTFLD